MDNDNDDDHISNSYDYTLASHSGLPVSYRGHVIKEGPEDNRLKFSMGSLQSEVELSLNFKVSLEILSPV